MINFLDGAMFGVGAVTSMIITILVLLGLYIIGVNVLKEMEYKIYVSKCKDKKKSKFDIRI